MNISSKITCATFILSILIFFALVAIGRHCLNNLHETNYFNDITCGITGILPIKEK